MMIRVYTWQDVINAVQILALYRNASFSDTAASVRLWHGFSNAKRQMQYYGTPLADWSLTEQERVLITAVMARASAEIIAAIGIAERGEWHLLATGANPNQNRVKFHAGLHFAADGQARQCDIDAAKIAGMDAVLVLAHTPPEFAYKIRAELGENTLILVRPFWSDGDGDFWNHTRENIAKWYAVGVRWFVFPNEPNLYPWEGMYTNWLDGAGLSQYYIQFAKQFKNEYPDAKLIFGNLSPHHDLQNGIIQIADFRKFWAECVGAGILDYIDAFGIHVYWQNADQMEQDYFGGHWRYWLSEIPVGKLLFVTEVANTNPNLNFAEKGRQLGEFYNQLRSSGRIAGAFAFCASHGENNWAEQLWTENGAVKPVASAFARAFKSDRSSVQLSVPSFSQIGGQYRNNCGAACLLMLAEWWRDTQNYPRFNYSVDKIKILTNGSNNANGLTSLAAIARAGKSLNLSLRTASNLTPDRIREELSAGCPVIVLVLYRHIQNSTVNFDGGHYLLVTGWEPSEQVFIVNDPLQGERRIPETQLYRAMSDTSTEYFRVPRQGVLVS